MGTNANSIHVRFADSTRLIQGVQDALRAEGYEERGIFPGLERQRFQDNTQRGVVVAEAAAGWSSVLDSDWSASEQLTQRLTQMLQTVAIWTTVVDSDEWSYALYANGERIDWFSSSGAVEQESIGPDYVNVQELQNLAGEFAKIGGMMSRFHEWLDREGNWKVDEDLRSKMEAIDKQLDAPGLASAEQQALSAQMQQLQAEMQASFRPFQERMQKKLEELLPEIKTPKRPRRNLAGHARRLIEALSLSTPQRTVSTLLRKRRVFAEESLCELLDLLGIPSVHGTWDYDTLCAGDETPPEETEVVWLRSLHFQLAAQT